MCVLLRIHVLLSQEFPRENLSYNWKLHQCKQRNLQNNSVENDTFYIELNSRINTLWSNSANLGSKFKCFIFLKPTPLITDNILQLLISFKVYTCDCLRKPGFCTLTCSFYLPRRGWQNTAGKMVWGFAVGFFPDYVCRKWILERKKKKQTFFNYKFY